MAEWDGVATALARINAVLYTTLAGVAAALVLFYVGDRTALRFKQWRLGGRSPRAAAPRSTCATFTCCACATTRDSRGRTARRTLCSSCPSPRATS